CGHRPVHAGHLTSALTCGHMPTHMLALLALVALALRVALRAVVVEEVKPAERDDDSEPSERGGGGGGGGGRGRPRVANAGSTPQPKPRVGLYSRRATAHLSPSLPTDPVRAARRFAALVVILEGLREVV